MNLVIANPALRTAFALSTLARLPVPMLSIGLLVHSQRLTGSFAAAGIVLATFAAASSVGGPLLGRLVDVYGQSCPLAAAAACSSGALWIVALMRPGASVVLLAGLSGLAGLAVPPVGASMRALLPGMVDRSVLPTAYALEATATELAFVAGPPVALVATGATSSGAAVAGVATLLGVTTIMFARQRAARAWRPSSSARRGAVGALRSSGMRTLVATFLLVGLLFGAVEVGVAAAGKGSASTGALLGLWGAGSLLGGLTLTRLGHLSVHSAQLALLLAGLTAGHLALAWAVTSELALAGALLLAGAAIAPIYATVNGIVEQVAPRAMTTEAFAWLTTSAGAGAALGAALTGIVAEHGGPPAAFLVAGGAGVVATVIVALRAGTLDADAPLPPSACCTTPDPAVV